MTGATALLSCNVGLFSTSVNVASFLIGLVGDEQLLHLVFILPAYTLLMGITIPLTSRDRPISIDMNCHIR